MFEVFITSRAERNLKAVPPDQYPGIASVIEKLRTGFYPDNHDVKKLKAVENSYRIREGTGGLSTLWISTRKRSLWVPFFPGKQPTGRNELF